MTDDHPPGTADLIDTATAYDAALHDVKTLTGLDAVPEVAAIAAHVDALQAALHATDLERLRAMSAADVGTVMHRQTVAQRDAAWADSERLRTAIDRARSIVTTCALATGHLWPDDGIAAQLADALAHTAHALDAATRPQPGMMQHHLRVAAQDADAVGTAGLIAARRWETAS